MTPTLLEHGQIGNKLAIAVSVSSRDGHRAYFQLYHINPNGSRLLMREESFGSDYEAEKLFDAWKKEAELLVAAGDM